jgi:acyl-CoA synthetase (AMP-forming)/AMP-acid ligase II
MNIAEILRDEAKKAGGRAAIIDRGGQVSFAELDRRSARMAAAFEAAGLRPGDRALVVHPIAIGLYAVLIGLFRLGATALILDPSAGREYLDRCCRLAAPRGFIASPRAHLLRILSSGIRRIPIKLVVRESTGRDEREHIEPCADETPALLTFTSGSTGEPKAALRTHGFLLAQHRVLADSLHLRPGAIDLTTLPVFVLSNLASGVTSLLPDADLRRPGAIDPAPVLRQVAMHRPASIIAAPAFLDRLMSAPPVNFDGVERIFTGGAPVFPRLLRRLHAIAPQATITAIYGSTEAEPIAHIDLPEIAADDFARMQTGAGLLAGHPIDAITLRILPDRWGTPMPDLSPPDIDATALPPGQIGEIVVTGPHVLRGYLNGTGDSETKIRAGDHIWHRTGDAGYLDATGRLWLMGRCSARITDTRGTLYPFAVEAAAHAIEGITRAALIANDGARLLAIELDRGSNEDATRIESTVHRTLSWAHLDSIIRLDTIPVDRRHNAKVDYVALRKKLRY